jgi:NDP-sugar pyrophosphorylase family protein
MKAVVLAGGVRSGLEVPGSGLPRALWPFPSHPLITHVIAFLKRAGCDQIAVCANGKTRMIAAELSSGSAPWLDLHYSEDPLPRGPAGCLRDLDAWLGAEPFIAIQGTASYDFDLAAMVQEHVTSAAAVTVGARRCPDDIDLLEPAGVYIVDPKTLPLIQPQGYQDFKEQFLPKVIAAGMRVRCHPLKGTATLIHSPGHYLSAMREAIVRAADTLPEGYRLLGDGIAAHASAVIHPTARLTGPVWIDANAAVGEGAVVAGPVVIGPGVRVGARALVHRTVAMRGALIEEGAEVFSAILPPATVRTAQPRRSPRPAGEVPARVPAARGPFDRLLSLFDGSRLRPAAH